MFIIMAAVTTVTLPYDVAWSTTLCPREVDHTGTTGSDVTAGNDVTFDAPMTRAVNATRRPLWTYYPFPYDSTLGWYTAAFISVLILAFLLCLGINRAKHAIINYWETR